MGFQGFFASWSNYYVVRPSCCGNLRSPQPGEDFWEKKGQLEEAKVLNYKSYKGGKIIREIFLEQTKTSNVRPKEISAVAEELEEQEFKESDNQ